ncbi:MAG: hypothetical protein KGZ25_12650 [Planctomycetes bacterium]|nr:hypothetical protein [Planctomycetota bacterium]
MASSIRYDRDGDGRADLILSWSDLRADKAAKRLLDNLDKWEDSGGDKLNWDKEAKSAVENGTAINKLDWSDLDPKPNIYFDDEDYTKSERKKYQETVTGIPGNNKDYHQ